MIVYPDILCKFHLYYLFLKYRLPLNLNAYKIIIVDEMIYKTINKDNIDASSNSNELDALLRTRYGFPLLNYAAVVVDVLIGQSILENKIGPFHKSDIIKAQYSLNRIKLKLSRFIRYINSSDYSKLLGILDKYINSLGNQLSRFQPDGYKYLSKLIPVPMFEDKKARPIKKSFQVAFIWTKGMKPHIEEIENAISWIYIIPLLDWFSSKLSSSSYWLPDDFQIRNLLSLRNFFRKKRIYHPAISASAITYFNYNKNRIFKPRLLIDHVDGSSWAYQIESIKFYPHKIITVFKINNKLFVRECIYDNNRFNCSFDIYNSKMIKEEREKCILEVPQINIARDRKRQIKKRKIIKS